jgi:GT2 family glycosyltransferase
VKTAVITVAHGRHEHLRRQHEMLWRSSRSDFRYLVVAIDDPALTEWQPCTPTVHLLPFVGTDGGLPVAAARNAGAAEALARGAELLIFLDVDCLPGRDLISRYERAAEQHGDSLLSGPVAYLPPPPADGYDLDALEENPLHPARPTPAAGVHQVDGDHRLFWSLSFGVTAPVWRRIGGFCPAYRGYGAEDTDFAQTAKKLGVGMTWVGGAVAYHQWHPTSKPPVQHLDDILRNSALFHRRWGWWPMEGWLAEFEQRGLISWDETGQRYVRSRPRPDADQQVEELLPTGSLG